MPLSIVGGLQERLTRRCYEKEEKNDSEMQLLDDVYRQVEEGGWLDNV